MLVETRCRKVVKDHSLNMQGKKPHHGQAFEAAALALTTETLDDIEKVGAMAVDEAAEENGEGQEERIVGDEAAEEKGDSPEG